jgi:serine protease Do
VSTIGRRALAAVALAAAAAPAAPAAEPERRSPIVAVVERVGPAVVNISTEQRLVNPFYGSPVDEFFRQFFERPPGRERWVQNSLGSGVVVDPAGYVLTNEHVIVGASRIKVRLAEGTELLAEVKGVDPRSDLAVLKVESPKPLPAAPLGRSDDLLIGETVIAIGNPFGLSSTVTTGVISALRRSVQTGDRVYTDFIQTDASINPGNSGGPLLNVRGELVGVNTAVHGEGQGIGFAIPVDRARRIVEDLIRYGEVRSAWIGVEVEEGEHGMSVRRVFENSAAARAGVQAGDVLRMLAGERIDNRFDMDTLVSRLRLGQTAALTVERGGQPLELRLALEEFPLDSAEPLAWDLIGIAAGPIPEASRQRLPFLPDFGVRIERVRPQSRAALRGFRTGDIILQVNDAPATDMSAFRRALARGLGRDSILLLIQRDHFRHYVTLELS